MLSLNQKYIEHLKSTNWRLIVNVIVNPFLPMCRPYSRRSDWTDQWRHTSSNQFRGSPSISSFSKICSPVV